MIHHTICLRNIGYQDLGGGHTKKKKSEYFLEMKKENKESQGIWILTKGPTVKRRIQQRPRVILCDDMSQACPLKDKKFEP